LSELSVSGFDRGVLATCFLPAGLFFLVRWSPVLMWVGTGHTSAQLTFLAWFRAARRTTKRQLFFRFDLHGLHHARLFANILFNCDHYAKRFR
jgi:hypothetical protein